MAVAVAVALALGAAEPKSSGPTVTFDAAWAAALRPGETARLPTGRYAGPWRIGRGVRLVARPGATLTADPAGRPTLSLTGDGLEIDGLTVEGPDGGIAIAAERCRGLALREVRILGGRRGLEAHGGSLSWRGGGASGSVEFGVWSQDARIALAALDLQPRAGTGLFVAGGDARVVGVSFAGGDYGVLLQRTVLDLRASRFGASRLAGLAIVRSRGRVLGCRFVGPYGEAAITAIAAEPLRLTRNVVSAAGAMGVKLVNSVGALEGNVIAGARTDAHGLEGDGLYLFESRVVSHGDKLSDLGGNGVVVLGGSARLHGCRIEGVGDAAAFVDEGGRLELAGCTIERARLALFVDPSAWAQERGCHLSEIGRDGGGGKSGTRSRVDIGVDHGDR